jgi:hypothetical protein
MTEDNHKSIIKCSYCDYKSQFSSNVTRHIRAKHPDKISSKSTDDRSSDGGEIDEEEASSMSFDELENIITRKVTETMKSNNLPIPEVVKKEGVIRPFMKSKSANVIAGAIIGFFLANNMQRIIALVVNLLPEKKNFATGLPAPPPPSMKQQEILRQMMMQQQTPNSVQKMSQETSEEPSTG